MTPNIATPTILTREIPRLKVESGDRKQIRVGIQITVTVRPDDGPTRNDDLVKERIRKLIKAGTSHFRLNLSHFIPTDPAKRKELSQEEYEARWRALVQCIASVRDELGAHVFIMLDTAGPEFRLSAATAEQFNPNDEVILSADRNYEHAKLPIVYFSPADFKSFGEQESKNREVRLADGECTAEVLEQLDNNKLRIRLNHSLFLRLIEKKESGLPGFPLEKAVKVNFPGFDLKDIPSIGPSDAKHLDFFLNIPQPHTLSGETGRKQEAPIEIDYIAQSFVRHKDDVQALWNYLNTKNVEPKPLIIAKIETAQAIEPKENLEEIVKHPKTAALMVARGDLGNECGRWKVPSLQGEIIRVAHSFLKPVIVATEVYGSMESQSRWQPTRSETMDLRSALEAGADGIMFTAETAGREDPETTVRYAVRQAHHDEEDIERLKLHQTARDERRERMEKFYGMLLQRPDRTLQSDDPFPLRTLKDFSTMDWACAAVYRANNRRAIGIFPFTVQGNTVRDMVHFLPYRPIVAITENPYTLARLALYGHVYPVLVEKVEETFDVENLKTLVQKIMAKFSIGSVGDQALATMPHPVRVQGGTDTLVLIRRA